MDSEKSSLNPSSLLDLKAELHKKYESFQREKLSQKSDPNPSMAFKRKDEKVSKEKKTQPKGTLKSNEENSEEELALKKSQLALEAKAKLYEKITSNNILIDDEDNEKYLVDFNRKVLYNNTPMPEKKEEFESKSSFVEENITPQSSDTYTKISYTEPVISDSQDNNKIEENQTDQPIHYQNILFNEVRDHGTGYFAFSMDESKRKEQMEELNKLRQQTEEQRVATQRMERKRKAVLEARLAKVCERRNIDKSVIQSFTKTEEHSESSNQEIDLSSIPLPEMPEVSEKKEVKVRPWDIGKTSFTPFVIEKRKIKSQSDWIQEKRTERPSEFAPPSFYR